MTPAAVANDLTLATFTGFVAALGPTVLAGFGAVVVHATDTGLAGLAAVAAAGRLVYGATVTIALRAGAWTTRRSAAERGRP